MEVDRLRIQQDALISYVNQLKLAAPVVNGSSAIKNRQKPENCRVHGCFHHPFHAN